MRASIGYDPKGPEENDKVLFGDNVFTFQQIREFPCVRPENDRIEDGIRSEVTAIIKGKSDFLTAAVDSLYKEKDIFGSAAVDYLEEQRQEIRALEESGDTEQAMEKRMELEEWISNKDRGMLEKHFLGVLGGVVEEKRLSSILQMFINTEE